MLTKVFIKFFIVLTLSLLSNNSAAALCQPDFKCEYKESSPDRFSLVDIAFCMACKKGVMVPDDLNVLYSDYKEFFTDYIITGFEGTGNNHAPRLFKNVNIKQESQKKGKNFHELTNYLLYETDDTSKNIWQTFKDTLLSVCENDGIDGEPWDLKATEEEYFQELSNQAENFQKLTTVEVRFNEFSARNLIKLYKTRLSSTATCDEIANLPDATDIAVAAAPIIAPGTFSNALAQEIFDNYYYPIAYSIARSKAYTILLQYYNVVDAGFSDYTAMGTRHKELLLKSVMLPNSNSSNLLELVTNRFAISRNLASKMESVFEDIREFELDRVGRRAR